MSEKNLYIIAGCNGAGKTTASFTMLPDVIQCREFVNADEIARGLSPFQPEKVAFEAGRIMLKRIGQLLAEGETFAFETTLSTKTFTKTLMAAKTLGYTTHLVFFWLQSVDLAKQRVAIRVLEGGHNIPLEVIKRRYTRGIKNLFELYLPIVDYALIFDNTNGVPYLIAEKNSIQGQIIVNNAVYQKLVNLYERN